MDSQHILPVLFEDDSILVINKPAGVIVNRADTTAAVITLQDMIEEQYGVAFGHESGESDFYNRSGIVHRLDKETSGVMVVAKTESAFVVLQKQFKAHEVEKIYKALCHGRVEPRHGIIDVPIGRLPWNRMRFGVLPSGRESKTEYDVKEYRSFSEKGYSEILSVVDAFPKSGRTHQIRVHFLYLGHPLFGDSLYAGRKTSRRDKKYISRHFLHAVRLTFTHPVTEKRVSFESPLPQELQHVLDLFPVTA